MTSVRERRVLGDLKFFKRAINSTFLSILDTMMRCFKAGVYNWGIPFHN